MVIEPSLSFERKRQKSRSNVQSKYPKLVPGKEFGIYKRLMARSGMTDVGNRLFLGRCSIHKKYYLDRKHTNGDIRCPLCDSKWLRKRGFNG